MDDDVVKESREPPADAQQIGYSLSDLDKEYVFFNHGALFAFAEFVDDPINEWYAQQPKGTVFIKQPFELKIFEGINAMCGVGKLTWNHVICMVSKESWLSLFPFMCGVVARNPRKKTFYQVFPQRASVLDPVMVMRAGLLHSTVERVNVVVFGVNGNKGLWSLQEPSSPTAAPKMIRTAPDPNTVAMAKNVFEDDFNQLKVRDVY